MEGWSIRGSTGRPEPTHTPAADRTRPRDRGGPVEDDRQSRCTGAPPGIGRVPQVFGSGGRLSPGGPWYASSTTVGTIQTPIRSGGGEIVEERLIRVSKFLAKYLRHSPEDLGLTLRPG